VAQENPDLGPRQRKRIAGPKSPPDGGFIDLLLRQARAVDRRQDMRLDRQGLNQRLDAGQTRTRALQRRIKALGPLKTGSSTKDLR